MPTQKYDEPVRLSQRWPRALLEAVQSAAALRGWDATQWLQEAAKAEIRREKAKAARES